MASNLLSCTTGLNLLSLTYLLLGDGTGRSLGLVEDVVGLWLSVSHETFNFVYPKMILHNRSHVK